MIHASGRRPPTRTRASAGAPRAYLGSRRQTRAGRLHDAGALETVASYLRLLEQAFLQLQELTGLAEFTRRNPRFRPLIVCSTETSATAERSGIEWTTWEDFLLEGG